VRRPATTSAMPAAVRSAGAIRERSRSNMGCIGRPCYQPPPKPALSPSYWYAPACDPTPRRPARPARRRGHRGRDPGRRLRLRARRPAADATAIGSGTPDSKPVAVAVRCCFAERARAPVPGAERESVGVGDRLAGAVRLGGTQRACQPFEGAGPVAKPLAEPQALVLSPRRGATPWAPLPYGIARAASVTIESRGPGNRPRAIVRAVVAHSPVHTSDECVEDSVSVAGSRMNMYTTTRR
jgi:hypothetical protein